MAHHDVARIIGSAEKAKALRARLRKTQNNRCYRCNQVLYASSRHAVIDHDHWTARIRGVACAPCNVALVFNSPSELWEPRRRGNPLEIYDESAIRRRFIAPPDVAGKRASSVRTRPAEGSAAVAAHKFSVDKDTLAAIQKACDRALRALLADALMDIIA